MVRSALVSEHRSWREDANLACANFPLNHLPYGVFDAGGNRHICTGIGDHLLDLYQCAESELLPSGLKVACRAPTLNALMEMGPRTWASLRHELTTMLAISAPIDLRRRIEPALYPIAETRMLMPVDVRNYTDFYTSIEHATRVGEIFRPNNPLLPNYRYIPLAYHGRSSSIVVSGSPLVRPHGQIRASGLVGPPSFGPTKSLDLELELAFYIGQQNDLGSAIPISAASKYLFGVSLLNDWSARDIQAWEYQPLGPFLGKNFATSVSAWVTPMAAIKPFQIAARQRQEEEPPPLEYLDDPADRVHGAFDIRLEVLLTTQISRKGGLPPFPICITNSKNLYWTAAQMVTHHTSNGCNLEIGDILATGTISGSDISTAGCLLERTRNGAAPISLPTGEIRSFLAVGDEVILRGYCERNGDLRLGLGECRGVVLQAKNSKK